MQLSTHTLTRYDNAVDFLAVVQPHLMRDEAVNNLMLGVTLRLQQHPDRVETPPYLAAVTAADELIAAAVMTSPYNVIVYSEHEEHRAAFAQMADALRAENWSVPGVNGPAHLSEAFAEIWQARTGEAYRADMRLRVYAVRQVTQPIGVAGSLRQATLADLDRVARWRQAFIDEAIPQERESDPHGRARRMIEDGSIYLWEDGEPVSVAMWSRPLLHGITVTMVYTPPHLRGRGYASACVAALSQLLLDQGWEYCTLFTDLANPTSNNIYQKIGYKPVCDYRNFRFSSNQTVDDGR